MSVKEEQFRMTLCVDLVCFLLRALLVTKPNKAELAKKIIKNWETSNKQLVKKSLETQASKIVSKDQSLINQKDEVSILLSAHELVFDSIRNDFVKEMTEGVVDIFNYEQKEA